MIFSGWTALTMTFTALSNLSLCGCERCFNEVFIVLAVIVATKLAIFVSVRTTNIYLFANNYQIFYCPFLNFYFIAMHYLGKNMRYLRKQMSKTQSEIASLIKKGQTTIGNWENGISEPNLDELLIISNFFDMPLDTLIKVDLAEANTAHRQGAVTSIPYDHSPESTGVVRERD